MYRSVLFDFDGTIFDTGEGVTKSVQYALHKMGIDEITENLRIFLGPPLVAMFMEKYHFTEQQAQLAVEFFRERYAPVGWKECRPYDGIGEVIQSIRNKGIEILIATSKPTHFAVDILREHHMSDLFDHVIGAGLKGDRTTKQEVIQGAIDASRFNADEMIYVGDRKYDVIGAHHFGIPCIGVRYGFAPDGELEEFDCDHIVDTPEQILPYIIG